MQARKKSSISSLPHTRVVVSCRATGSAGGFITHLAFSHFNSSVLCNCSSLHSASFFCFTLMIQLEEASYIAARCSYDSKVMSHSRETLSHCPSVHSSLSIFFPSMCTSPVRHSVMPVSLVPTDLSESMQVTYNQVT